MYDFFDKPGVVYNFVNLTLALVGVVLGIVALVFAWVQIAKTLKAAKAAETAAKETAQKLNHLNALIGVNKLAALANDALTLMGSKDFKAAAIRAKDLRIGMAEFQNSPGARELGISDQWKILIIDLSNAEKDLRTHNFREGKDKVAERCMDCLVALHTELHSLAGAAARIIGE